MKLEKLELLFKVSFSDWVLVLGSFLTKNFKKIGLLEIKCPDNKRNLSIKSILTDKTFYIALNNDKKPYLKKEHHYFGYYTEIQVAMGLAVLK